MAAVVSVKSPGWRQCGCSVCEEPRMEDVQVNPCQLLGSVPDQSLWVKKGAPGITSVILRCGSKRAL